MCTDRVEIRKAGTRCSAPAPLYLYHSGYVTYCTGGRSRNPLYVRTASGSVFFSVTARVWCRRETSNAAASCVATRGITEDGSLW